MEKPRCVATVYPSWSMRGVQCGNAGKLEYDGKPWCKTHHPPTVEAKTKALHAKWDEEQKQRDEKRRAENINRDLRDKALAWMREAYPACVAAWERELEEKWKL
jgi:hypothetical protein